MADFNWQVEEETFDEFATEDVDEDTVDNEDVEPEENNDPEEKEQGQPSAKVETEDTSEKEEVENEEVVDEPDVEETEEEAEEDIRIVDDIISQFDLPEDQREGLEDTWDGVVEATKRAADVQTQRQVEGLMKQYPDVGQYLNYRLNGGDPQKYQEEVLRAPSYEDMEISEDDVSTQETLVRQRLQSEGLDDSQISEEIEDLKSAGLLKKQAERSKGVLAKKQKEKQEQLIKEQERQKQEQLEQARKEQEEYKNLIQNSSELGGLRIPETKKDDFTSFMFDPVNEEGVTQADQAWSQMSKEDRTALEYLVYLSGGDGLDLSGLVDNLASTKKAKSLSDSLRKTRGSNRTVKDSSQRNPREQSKDFDADDVDFSQMFS